MLMKRLGEAVRNDMHFRIKKAPILIGAFLLRFNFYHLLLASIMYF